METFTILKIILLAIGALTIGSLASYKEDEDIELEENKRAYKQHLKNKKDGVKK